jgi:predicted DNA-binding transcriptional regulator AlpA
MSLEHSPARAGKRANAPVNDESCRNRLLTSRDAAKVLSVSESWLAKSRMRGDGPAFVKIGRAVRYDEGALQDYVRSRRRLSTSER